MLVFVELMNGKLHLVKYILFGFYDYTVRNKKK